MSRTARNAPGGLVYHVLNRAVARLPLFQKAGDYEAFDRVLIEAQAEVPTRLLAYCLMPNHWHMVLWPEKDGELSDFVGWLTHTHSMRWHAHFHTGGTGHIYQGRFKSFPIETDEHLYTVLRYVERNALRANLVSRAEAWRWGSLWRRHHGTTMSAAAAPNLFGETTAQVVLHDWPVTRPANWVELVNMAQTEAELEAVRRAVVRNSPFGSEAWSRKTAAALGLEATLQARGRPGKKLAGEADALFDKQ